MRTTATLDDDLYEILEREAKIRRVSFQEMLNTTLRQGLASQPTMPASRPTVVTKPFPFQTRPGLDFTKINQLNDALEVETFLEKAARERIEP